MIFTIDESENLIFVDIESDDLYPKYYDLFGEYDYEGNGYCWEGHIIQILEKLKPDIIKQIEFDPEAGAIAISSYDRKTLSDLANLLNPIFSDVELLRKYIEGADRDRVDD